MSSVDERIVRMKFDNAQFEQGVSESLNSIDRLNKKLDSTESVTAFEGLSKSADNVDLSGIEKAVDHIADRFSVLGTIATTVLVNIANQAFQTGQALVKSLSVDNIVEGWNKYDQEVQSVQTIMVTLGDTTTMEEVEGQLEKLAWFSDETSYSYTQMTDSLAKFISAGMGMEDSVTAVMGLANAAAAAGVSTQKASSAFYNFSQAMGTGYMGLQDWRSIEMLNMATPQFKQNILDSAVALGKLKTTIDDTGETLYYFDKKEEAFSANGLRASLKDRWLDQDVMMDVLKRYGEFSDKVKELQSEYDYYQASNVIKDAEKLGLALDTFSAKAFMAAQEAKTFQEAIDATKDAVSTKWKDTFEYIFGNYEEAKGLWTDFSEFLYNLFATSGDERNELLEKWKDLGGRDALIEGFYNIMESILNIVNAIKDAWHDIFPPMTEQRLVEITENFRDLTERMLITEERAEKIKKVLTPVFRVIRFIVDAIKALFTQIKRLGPPLQNLLDKFKEIVGPLWDKLKEKFEESSLFSSINTDETFISKVFDFIIWCIDKITWGIGKLQELLGPVWSKLKDRLLSSDLFSKFNTDGTFLTLLANVISAGFQKIKEGIDTLKEIKIDWTGLTNLKNRLLSFKEQGLDAVTKSAEKFSSGFSGINNTVQTTLTALSATFRKSDLGSNVEEQNKTVTGLQTVWETFLSVVTPVTSTIGGVLSTFINGIQDMNLGDIMGTAIIIPMMLFIFRLSKLMDGLNEGLEGIADVFSGFSKILKAKAREFNSKALLNFIAAVGILVAAIVIFSNFVDNANLDKAMVNIGGLIIVLLVVMGLMNKLSTMLGRSSPSITWSKNGIGFTGFGHRTGLIALAVSLLGVVLAIKFMYDIISQENAEELVQKVANMMFLMVAALGIIGSLLTTTATGRGLGLQTFYPLVLVGSLLLMVNVIKKIDQLQIEDYTKVIVSIISILTLLTTVAAIASKTATGARAVLSIAASLLIVTVALNLLNKVAKEYDIESFAVTVLALAIMALIVWASTIVDKASEAHIIQKGQKFKGQGSAIVKIALGMLSIVLALKMLTKLEWNTIYKALALFVPLMGLVTLALAASKKAGTVAGETIKSIAKLITTMGLMITLLSLVLKFNPEQVLQAGIVVSGLLVVVSVALGIMALIGKNSNFGVTTKFVVALSVLMGILTALLVAFYFLDDKGKLFEAAGILAVLLAAISAVVIAMTKFSGDIFAFNRIKSSILVLVVILGLVTLALISLSRELSDASQLPKAALAMTEIATAIGILLVAFGAFVRLAQATTDIQSKSMTKGILGFCGVLIVIIGAIIAASKLIDFDNLSNFSKDLLIGIGAFIAAVVLVEALVSLIGLIPASAMLTGILGMAIIMSIIFEVAREISVNVKNISLEDLQEFQEKLIAFGNIILTMAQIIGYSIGYVLFGWLPVLVEMITLFAEGLGPLSDAISKLPDNFSDQITKFGAAMLSLVWYSGIATLINDAFVGPKANILVQFTEKLKEAVPNLVYFFKEMSVIENVDQAIKAMEALSRLANSISTMGSLSGSYLIVFGSDIRDFFDYIGFLSQANIDTVEGIHDCLILLSDERIDYTKFDSNMASASYNLSVLAQNMTTFAQNTTNPQLFKNAAETAPYLMSLIAELSTSEHALSSTSGLFLFLSQDIFNNGGIGNFGERLKSFTSGIYYYATMLNNMDMAKLNTAVARTTYITQIVEALSTSEKSITPNSGLFSYIKAHPNIGKFIGAITEAIPKIKDYISAITTGVTLNDLSNAVGRTELLSKVLTALSTANDAFEKDNSGKIKNLAKALGEEGGIADKLIVYTDKINGHSGDIYKVSSITSQIANAIKSLVNADNTADIEAFNYALERMVTVGLDEWLEVFKKWPKQDKLNNAVQEFTDGIVLAFGHAENSEKISESLVTPINNLLKTLNAKGINFYNTGHKLTQQLLDGLNSLKLEYKSSLEEIKNIPTSILDSVSSDELKNNAALSGLAAQLQEITDAANGVKETVPMALEEAVTAANELGVTTDISSGERERSFIEKLFNFDITSKYGQGTTQSNILEMMGLDQGVFDFTKIGGISAETFGDGFFDSVMTTLSPETFDYTAISEQFMSEMQSSLDQYGMDMGGLTVDVMPVLSDGSTIADFEGLMGDMYGPNIQYNTDAITNLTEKVAILNTKLDTLTTALGNQTITHSGTINVKYTNQQGLVDSVTKAIIDNLRIGGRS